ncbi:aldo/keto reductase [Rugosimonospora africana]|uniref:Aldo/keto reductase n=1 Tax=Rugosimonospora africana TaxID=556532 RepID=A0A8J3VSU2_9ACTN|nr:aldo/keto reductase [Rugosimonospora africana]GIH17379.1 aldo/keto reductase [Rugosimonospora africana]
MMSTRILGRSGIEVSALGMGCWAIGGPFWSGDQPLGWGEVDDEESVRAVRRALDLGVTFFDTANVYGCGHSERVLGRALGADRDRAVIATKWGNLFDEQTRQKGGRDTTPAGVRTALEASLRRLGTDYIDLYQLHVGDLPVPAALDLVPALDEAVKAGSIRGYAWSTDDSERVAAFAEASVSVTAVQHDFSVLNDDQPMLDVCDRFDLASVNRGPLAMGLLTGKYTADSRLGGDDVRGIAPEWMRYFVDGRPAPEWLARVDAVREILTSDGRTLVQGALGWLWARSPRTVPIPGCRTVAQVEENAGALERGPLTAEQVAQIASLLGR